MTQPGRDALGGLALLIVGGGLAFAHRYSTHRVETAEERDGSRMAMTGNLSATILFGLISLVTLPSAAMRVAQYAQLWATGVDTGALPPGHLFAAAVVFAGAWAWYLRRTLRPWSSPRPKPEAPKP